MEQFGWRKDGRGRTKLRSQCRNCTALETRERNNKIKAEQPELHEQRRKKARTRDRQLWETDPERWLHRAMRQSARTLGVDVDDVLDHLADVGNVCDACGWQGEAQPGRRAHIDHCHRTQKFRGFLCGGCNASAGHAADGPDRMLKIVNYLFAFKPEDRVS